MKGGAENARKLLPKVWKSDMSFWQKLHSTSHLMSSSVFLFVFIMGVFSVPTLFALPVIGLTSGIFKYFLVSLLSVIAVYYVANVQAELDKQSYGKMLFKFIFLFPLFLALSMGLSLHNTVAVIQGYIGKKSPFIRTPKFNIQNIKDSFKKQNYLAKKLPWTTIFEGLLAVYFLFGILGGIYLKDWSFLLFHGMLMVGFGSICFYSVRHWAR